MTKIVEARVTPIAFTDPPLLNVWGVHSPWCLRAIIEIELEGGVVGLGECQGGAELVAAIRGSLPALINQPVERRATLLDLVRRAAIAQYRPDAGHWEKASHHLLVHKVVSAIEVALLDGLGKQHDLRVCDILGGAVREEVSFCGYLFYMFGAHIDAPDRRENWPEALTHEAIVEQARRAIAEQGYRALKLKGGVFEPAFEIETLRQLHAAFPGVPLRYDPNCGWSLETTRRYLPALQGLLEYLEDPIEGVEPMGALQREIAMPLSTNMCVVSFDDIPKAVAAGGPKIILADHHYWGGLAATVELGRHCETFGFGLSMHSNSHLGISLLAMAHAASAVPNLTYAVDTHYHFQADEVVRGGRIKLVDGRLRIPDASGLGVELDRDALARLAANYEVAGGGERNDRVQMRKYRPDWTGTTPRF